MTKILITLVLGVAIGAILWEIGFMLQPNYRWIRIKNNTECKVSGAAVRLVDRVISVDAEQVRKPLYPYSKTWDFYIPVLASKEPGFRIRLEFEDCPDREGDLQEFKSGTYTDVWVYKNKISYGTR